MSNLCKKNCKALTILVGHLIYMEASKCHAVIFFFKISNFKVEISMSKLDIQILILEVENSKTKVGNSNF